MRLEIVSDQSLHTKCQLCTDNLATRLVRYKLDNVMFRRFVCNDCRAWLRSRIESALPRGIRAVSEGDGS